MEYEKLNIEIINEHYFDKVEELEDCIKLYSDGVMRFRVYRDSKVYAYANSIIDAYDNSKVYAKDSSKVYAYDTSKVYAYNSSKVIAYDNSKINAYDNSEVYTFDNSKVIDCGNSKTEKEKKNMHFAGIMIKEKSIDVVQARTTLGDLLVESGLSDWYSTNDYRERTFDGKQEISLDDFKIKFEERKKDNCEAMPLVLIENMSNDEDDIDPYIVESYISHDFYEFEETYRDKLVALYNEAYYSAIDKLINDLDKDKYNVCLLDYHF